MCEITCVNSIIILLFGVIDGVIYVVIYIVIIIFPEL